MGIRLINGDWWVDFRVKKKRYRQRPVANTRQAALELEHRMRTAIGRRLAGLPLQIKARLQGDVRFATFAEVWSDVYVPGLKRSTREGYCSVLKRALVPRFGALLVEAISETAIDAFAAEELKRGLTAKTLNNVLGVLRRCLGTARRWGLIENVPEIHLRRIRPPETRYFTAAESGRLLAAAAGTRWWLFLLCALRTGLRACELIALRWEDIDLATGTVHVRRGRFHGVEDSPKSNRVRAQPMTSDLWEAFLREPRRISGYVFTHPSGRPLSWDAAWRAMRKFCRLSGLPPAGVHALRHSYGSQLAMEGVDLLELQRLMGHSTTEMTARYIHLPSPYLRACAQTLLRAGARIAGGQEADKVDPRVLEEQLKIADSYSANVGTQTPPREEEASLVPRRGFEALRGATRMAKVGKKGRTCAVPH